MPSSVLAAFVMLGAAAALTSNASAQSAEDAATTPLAPPSTIDLSPSEALSGGQGSALTPQEQLQRAEEFAGAIEQASQSILRQLEIARKERDVVRVLCLNDKLNQVDVALRSAQDRMGALKTAVERGDADRSKHEFTVLDVLNDRVRVLVNESSQCVGEETGFIGEAEVSVTIDPNLPDADTGQVAGSTAAPPPPPSINSPIQ